MPGLRKIRPQPQRFLEFRNGCGGLVRIQQDAAEIEPAIGIVRLEAHGFFAVRNRSGTRYPAGLAVSPDGARLYVAENLADSLAVVDLASGRVVDRLPTERYPYGVAVAPNGTVWLPVNQCGGHQGGAVSTDNDTTWHEFIVTGSVAPRGSHHL